LSARQAADEALAIQRTQAEYDTKLTSLYRQLEQQTIWGNATLADIEKLKAAGIEPRFFIMSSEEAGQVKAEFSITISDLGSGKVIVAIIDRGGKPQIPEKAEQIAQPAMDNPSIRAEASEIDAKRKQSTERLAGLANLLPQIQLLRLELEEMAQFSIATNGALKAEDLFAIQGWVPAEEYERLTADLESKKITAAVRGLDPAEDENPPTLIRYPRWAMPIKGLFDILATYPGYREMDLSVFFMLFLPIFAGMLIGDAGYGFLFVVALAIFYRKLSTKIGKEKVQLVMLFGATALIWGILNATYFGLTPETMARAGGFINANDDADYAAMKAASGGWSFVGKLMIDAGRLWKEDGEAYRTLLIQISFLVGCIHLVLAHLRHALALWPNKLAIADIGWSIVLVGMLGAIWGMFFEYIPVSSMVIVIGIAAGLGLVVWFGSTSPNPIRRVLVGLLQALFPLIGTFGDTMSYIRLMAVGLASGYISMAFNDLGSTIAESGTWAAAAPILIFGHALNMMLAAIAIFAHGVRLNMLEFSNNAGMQWTGYPYSPFTKTKI
ncbi:MAG: hypothetical protein WC749_11730, partial [Dehalococcoidia bacterium]